METVLKLSKPVDDIDFITDDIVSLKQLKTAHKRTIGKKSIKIRSSVEVARSVFKQAQRLHKQDIKEARHAIKQNKRAIKQHYLLIKQARSSYKLVVLAHKK